MSQLNIDHSQLRDSFMDVTHPVSRQEPVFSRLEYLIRLSLNSVSANIYRLYSIKTSQEMEEFKRGTNGAYFDAWFNLNSEKMKDYSLERIAMQGFDVPENGITLKTGHLTLDRDMRQDHTLHQHVSLDMSLHGVRRKKIYKLLHCCVAPGKSFFASNKMTEAVLPKGYDSIYIQPDAGEELGALYRHKYVIFNAKRIFPDYIVFLEYDPDGDEKLRLISGSNDREFFETNERIINEAYEKAKATINEENPNAQLETSMIDHELYFEAARDHLEKIENARRSICENAEVIENELREMFRKSISRLHEITQLKLSDLLSEEAELRRRLEEIEWMNRFINYQKESVTPVNFLDSFAQHNLLKRDKIEGMETTLNSITHTMQTVIPDIRASGDLGVASNSTAPQEDHEYKVVPLVESERVQFDEEGHMVVEEEREVEESGIYLDDQELLMKKQDTGECIIC